jgi:DNA-directed RNA polymerase specialized sigma24 family protein
MDPASIKKLSDPKVALDLADYYEQTAARLREHAAILRKTKTIEMQRKARRARAGRVAYAFIENGMDRLQAIREASRECNLPADLVEQSLGRLETYLAVKRAEKIERGIRRLADLGLSVREIAAKTGIPKSSVHRRISARSDKRPSRRAPARQ